GIFRPRVAVARNAPSGCDLQHDDICVWRFWQRQPPPPKPRMNEAPRTNIIRVEGRRQVGVEYAGRGLRSRIGRIDSRQHPRKSVWALADGPRLLEHRAADRLER